MDSLTEEQKAGLDFSQPDKLPLLEGVIQAANQKRELCEQKRWKFTNRKGEVVVIRDVMAKVVYWVKMFVQVGDQIASFDQAHAALPWAAVRFLLQVRCKKICAIRMHYELKEILTNAGRGQ